MFIDTKALGRNRRLIFVLAFALFLGGQTLDRCRAAEIPAAIRDALERNTTNLSPITVSWTSELSSDLPLQEWLKKVHVEPFYVDEFSPIEVVYSWQDGMTYCHAKQLKADISDVILVDADGTVRARPGADLDHLSRSLHDNETACDLRRIFIGSDRAAAADNHFAPTLTIESLDAPKFYKPNSHFFSNTWFHEAGFSLPEKISEQRRGARSLPLALLAAGSRQPYVPRAMRRRSHKTAFIAVGTVVLVVSAGLLLLRARRRVAS